jgi:hypothetical protein
MLKGYWTAFGKFLKGVGKPLGNYQEGRQTFPAAIGKNMSSGISFL